MLHSEPKVPMMSLESEEAPESIREEPSSKADYSGLARAYRDMGREAMLKGQPAQAIDYYKEALQHEPKSVELHNYLGEALLEIGKWEEAKTYFTEALKLNPDDMLARTNLEIVLSKLKS